MRISSGGGVVRLKTNDVKLNRAERKAIWTGVNNISETHRATGSLMKRVNEYHSNAQRQNDQNVLGIAPGLNRVIPAIEHLNHWANKADGQNKPDESARKSRFHRVEYITPLSPCRAVR